MTEVADMGSNLTPRFRISSTKETAIGKYFLFVEEVRARRTVL